MLLALDTATQAMSLALHDGSQLLYEATWHTPNHHTIELTPAIRRALKAAEVVPGDLTAVAVAQGPGSFTGLRIGMGAAKGLAVAQDISLIAVPSLFVLAAAIPVCEGYLVAVLRAGRGRVCAQRFLGEGSAWHPLDDPVIADWATLSRSLTGSCLVAGEIDDAGRTLLQEQAGVRIGSGAVALRRAGFLAELGWERMRQGDTDDVASVSPIYLHQPGVPHP